MNDRFYVGIFWTARRESCGACATRVSAMFRELVQVSARFGRWFLQGESRADALRHQISTDTISRARLLLQNRPRRDDNNAVMEELGFHMNAWTGAAQGIAMSIHVHCGSYSPRIRNFLLLNLPTDDRMNGDILNYAELHKILLILVRCFEPDWGVVTSDYLRSNVVKLPVEMPTAGWLTYLSRKYLPIAKGRDYEVEKVGDLGELLVATREPFDSHKPEHVRSVLEIADGILRNCRLPPG